MNIVMLTRIWPNALQPTHGTFVEQRALRLARRPDCQLRVVAPVPFYPPLPWPRRYATYGAIPARELRAGIPVEHPRYGVVPKIGLRWQGPALARAVLPTLARLHAECAIDLLEAHYLYPDGFAAVEAGRRLGIPTVLDAIGSDVYGLPRLPGIAALTRHAIDGATRLIAVSESIRNGLVALGAPRGKIDVVPYGVDATRFAPGAAGAAKVRESLGIAPDERVVLNVGRLHPMKAQDVLVDAFASIADRARDVRLVVVGEGDLRAALAARIRARGLDRRVILAGSVPHAELPAWYGAASLFCLPSRGEGHPNALLEALASGLPAVVTDVGAMPEMVPPSCGFVVPPEDRRALGTALLAALAAIRDGLLTPAAAREAVAGRDWDDAAADSFAVFAAAQALTARVDSTQSA